MNDRMRLIQDVIMKDPMIYYDFVDYEYEMRDPKEIVEDLKDKIEEDFPKPRLLITPLNMCILLWKNI